MVFEKKVKFFLPIICLGLVFLAACSNVTENRLNESGDVNPKPNANSAFYFLLQDDAFIVSFQPYTKKLDTIFVGLHNVADFAVGSGGNVLFAISTDSIFRKDLLQLGLNKRWALTYKFHDRLVCGNAGPFCAYETVVNGIQRIALFNEATGQNVLIEEDNPGALTAPLLSTWEKWLAFSAKDGLYLKSLSSNTVARLSDSSLKAQDFSPAESYLSADGRIFDLITLKKEPVERSGLIKFIDEFTIIWVPWNSALVKKANLSGTEEVILFETKSPVLDFAISPERRFVVAVNAEAQSLVFTVFDFLDMELESTLTLSQAGHKRLIKLTWPEKPGDLTHYD